MAALFVWWSARLFLGNSFFFSRSQALEGLLFTLFAVDEVARGLKFLMVPPADFFSEPLSNWVRVDIESERKRSLKNSRF